MQPAAAHALRAHVCGLRNVFFAAHVTEENKLKLISLLRQRNYTA